MTFNLCPLLIFFPKSLVLRWAYNVLVFLSIIFVFKLIEYMYSLQSDMTSKRKIIRHTPSSDILGDFCKSDNFVFLIKWQSEREIILAKNTWSHGPRHYKIRMALVRGILKIFSFIFYCFI